MKKKNPFFILDRTPNVTHLRKFKGAASGATLSDIILFILLQ